ncbi:MAG: hypothetical protein JWN70_6049 [Planctomycetaceae bacterium]|nr:hypothetical protein [Planctomycetaceae bacterium]
MDMISFAIAGCRVAECPVNPWFVRDAISVCVCPVCHCNVYDSSCLPGSSKWQKIAADSTESSHQELRIGDFVRILEGDCEGFEATIEDINQTDQAARIILNLMGRHVPFWTAFRSLQLVKTNIPS